MFIRIIRQKEQKEMLLNINHISKIDVLYAVPNDENNEAWGTSLQEGHNNPHSVRCYRLYIGSETYLLAANTDSAVMKSIEEIYESAIKD